MDLFKLLLIVHIIGGGLSFILGFIILLLKKGNKQHTFLGKIYFISMLTAALVALPMSYLHSNLFLFIIGVFTSYMLLTGTRYLAKKSINDVNMVDWTLSLAMLLFGLGFIIYGILILLSSNSFGIVLLVFGGISLLYVSQDYQNFKGKSKVKNYWLSTHIQRMIGSYIASTTAFLVVNNHGFLPEILAWLLPTLLLVPLLIFWSKKHEIKVESQ